MQPRREFLAGLAGAATIPALVPLALAASELAQAGGPPPVFDPDPAAQAFWAGFLTSRSLPSREPVRPRSGGPAVDRETFFFHQGKQGLQPAVDIPPSELIADGDVSVSINVAAFKPADADRDTFERLQSAQLRLDFVQNISIVDLIDTMAWTAVALLRPDKQNKLPPIQSLSFDPSTAWKKMQNIVLPKGQGRWAVNLYAQRGDSFWSRLLQVLNKEVGRFAPVLGLPGISTIALQSFNEFYGAFHSRPEYLFRSNPVPVFATASAAKQGPISNGLPLRTGTYILVPMAHAHELTDAKLATLELKQGLLVPKGTDTVAVRKAAEDALRGVTYATIDLVVKPVQLPCK